MNRRDFLRALPAAAAGAAAGGRPAVSAARSAQKRPPNIVFVLADDLGWAELGCYGNRFNETPALDQFAREGMRFTHAYASAPVCSPFRASLMSGQWPARVGITDYLRPNDAKFLSVDHVTFVERLRDSGYATGMMGKWHLTGYVRSEGAPRLHGFDEVICSETRGIGGGSYWHPYRHMPAVQARAKGEYLTDRLAAEAEDFIGRHKYHPFFLYVSHYSVHARLVGKKEKVAKYSAKAGAGKTKNNPVLAAMLESIDECFARILAALEKHKLTGHTLVIFTSDNGGEDRVTTNGPLRAGKSTLYEGGIREPLIVRLPGVVKPGSVCDTPVSTVDFYPTLLEAAGAKPDPKQRLDGLSLMPLLKGTGSLARDTLYWHYPLARRHFLGGRSAGAIRKSEYKLIEFFDTGEIELYDLAGDVGEKNDLAAKMPRKAAELRKALAQWRKSVGAADAPPAPPAPRNVQRTEPLHRAHRRE